MATSVKPVSASMYLDFFQVLPPSVDLIEPALRIRAEQVAHGRHVDDVRIGGIHDDAADGLRVVEARDDSRSCRRRWCPRRRRRSTNSGDCWPRPCRRRRRSDPTARWRWRRSTRWACCRTATSSGCRRRWTSTVRRWRSRRKSASDLFRNRRCRRCGPSSWPDRWSGTQTRARAGPSWDWAADPAERPARVPAPRQSRRHSGRSG